MKLFKYIFVFFIAFTSCKSAKKTTDNLSEIESLSARKVAKKHVAASFNEKSLEARLRVNYKDTKEDVGFSVKMRLKKDEVIWLKGTKIITVFKAKITPTKVSFYSPYKKNYFEGDFSMLTKLLGVEVNFEQLQSMLLGEALLNVREQRQNVDIINASYRLSPKKQPTLFDVFFDVNPSHFKLNKQSLINPIKEQRLDIDYPSYSTKNNVLYPSKISILGKSKKKFTKIDITYRSVEFNKNLNFDFRIPAGYKEIKL
ncbi:hypothetical protein WH52_05145 [Tenacibaculum holothuriorum]|uniref:Deoxyuridine 5'-triphosphate nucleotidohydrolase n=1 Tax=Tenacibaculum holothuriorum TaxID=1635173 RepID=A0A1Y2PGX3_9FLAO|nr:DUF4292 domain-containing protein [Tenacibaculum holothuriorum]OSY89047.1 hypothetical protein WH52_05145 [Tenacibaculum holothuriorum]